MTGVNQVRIHPDVQAALSSGAPVVALESTVITHGLPSPDNLAFAREVQAVVAEAGAVPATVAVCNGEIHVGADQATLERIDADQAASKLSLRDLAAASVKKVNGGTTVAATAYVAARVGIRVFATGGIGGVHRGAAQTWDVSADLDCLARTPIAVVCSGVKSLLDVAATLERLETLGVPVLGYRTGLFPAFYLRETNLLVDWCVSGPDEAAAILATHWDLGVEGGVVIANPAPAEVAMDPEEHEKALVAAIEAAAGTRGKGVTPVLLEAFHEITGGASVATNIALLKSNADVAARIAVALADL